MWSDIYNDLYGNEATEGLSQVDQDINSTNATMGIAGNRFAQAGIDPSAMAQAQLTGKETEQRARNENADAGTKIQEAYLDQLLAQSSNAKSREQQESAQALADETRLGIALAKNPWTPTGEQSEVGTKFKDAEIDENGFMIITDKQRDKMIARSERLRREDGVTYYYDEKTDSEYGVTSDGKVFKVKGSGRIWYK